MAKIDISSVYCHSLIGARRYALKKLNNIFKMGVIVPPCNNPYSDDPEFNRLDEICLSKFEGIKLDGYESAFHLYVNTYITLLLKEPAKLYRPSIIRTDEITQEKKDSGLYTNLFDEWRTDEFISVDDIVGISIPVECLFDNDLNYLLFNSVICSILSSEEDADMRLSRYAFLRGKELRDYKKAYNIDDAISKIEKLLKKYNLDIPLYEYSEKELCFKTLRR